MHLFDPRVGLSLWVDVQSPSVSFCDANTVFCGELINWKSVRLPFLDCCLRAKEVAEFVLRVVWQFKLTNLLQPDVAQRIAIVCWEGTAQTHEG